MSELMRKILYYENILEFKENTKSSLLRSEVKDWRRLCRTCLADTDETSGCVDLERMSVLDMDGSLLSLQQMLLEATGAQISSEEKKHRDQLPRSICKDCLGKVTTLYYFKLQTKRAEKVLERLLAKLKEADSIETTEAKHCQQKAETTSTNTNDDVNVTPDCSSTSGTNEFIPNDCSTKLALAAKCAAAPLFDIPLKLEETPIEELDNVSEQRLNDLEEEEEFIKEVENDLAEITYIEIDDKDEEGDETFEEATTSEALRLSTITEHYEDDTDATATDSIEQEYYLEDLQQLADNSDVNSCSNEKICIVMLSDESDQGKEEHLATDVEITQETAGFTKSTTDNRAPKRKRKAAKGEKPMLENLKCIICEEEFDKLRLLVEHVQREHRNAKAFKCRVCGNAFAHMQSLSRHMRHHKPLQRKYVCDKISCGKEFLRPDDWTRHMRIHTGERPYPCDQCPKAFKQPSELKEHQRSHSTEKQFQCDICNHRLASRNGLYVHKKAHSGIKKFVCVHCEKRFLTSGELKAHTKLHLKKFTKDER